MRHSRSRLPAIAERCSRGAIATPGVCLRSASNRLMLGGAPPRMAASCSTRVASATFLEGVLRGCLAVSSRCTASAYAYLPALLRARNPWKRTAREQFAALPHTIDPFGTDGPGARPVFVSLHLART